MRLVFLLLLLAVAPAACRTDNVRSIYPGGPPHRVHSSPIRLTIQTAATTTTNPPQQLVFMVDGVVFPPPNPPFLALPYTWEPGVLPPGPHILAVYSLHPPNLTSSSPTTLLATRLTLSRVWCEDGCAAGPSLDKTLLTPTREHASLPALRVGVYYTPYSTLEALAMLAVQRKLGAPPPTVEDVLQSNGSLLFPDIVDKHKAIWLPVVGNLTSSPSWYQSRPALGFYCLFAAKNASAPALIPDCPDIAATLTAHAHMLTTAGVDHVVFDLTNCGNDEPGCHATNVRPTEVVFETFAALRSRGISTPQLAAWNRIDDGDVLWQTLLGIYNNASYDDLILRQTGTGLDAKVFFYVSKLWNNADEQANISTIHLIETNDGRFDVVAQPMWETTDKYCPPWYLSGTYTYMESCSTVNPDPASKINRRMTTSLDVNATCNHLQSVRGTLGAQYTVSTTIAPASLPFWSPGKLGGLWLRKQFEDVFAAQTGSRRAANASAFDASLGAKPDLLFAPSFNEFVIMPQNITAERALPAVVNTYIQALGASPSDPLRRTLLVDGYGAFRSRTLEPSVHDNGTYLELFASCVRVARLLAAVTEASSSFDRHRAEAVPLHLRLLHQAEAGGVGSGGAVAPCPVAGEVCCETTPEQDFVSVWSFQSPPTADSAAALQATVLTADQEEVAQLRANTSHWREVCVPFSGQTTFCENGTIYTVPDDDSAIRGPFLLWRQQVKDSVPLLGADGQRLGFMAATPSSLMPRPLRRCTTSAAGVVYHTVDGPCVGGDDGYVLGFVL